ncbi:MAG TPA: kelch repeat-containing protein, partial [Phycisphaerae bacterium]|nr:kelch repeat-containing protein [Phycisphaerae bacterium]
VRELSKAERLLGGKVAPDAIQAADAARDGLLRAMLDIFALPRPRAHARMVYDAKNKRIVLFGGDALDRLLGDTWVYDPAMQNWEERRPKLSPSPRSGYRMAYLPKSGKVLLIDGYGYKGSGEMWAYDARDNEWQLLAEGGAPRGPAQARDWFPLPAAANGDDLVVTFFRDGKAGLGTYAARIDASRVDHDGTAKLGVPPLTESSYPIATEDPQWFEGNAPPADPAAEEDWLKKLPANTWVVRQAPNWPKIEYGRSRCWGTCALDTAGNEILSIGGYGNQDCCGPDSYVVDPAGKFLRPRKADDPKDLTSPFAKPEIAFAWIIGVAVTDKYAYVSDAINKRVLRVKLDYAAEETVLLP